MERKSFMRRRTSKNETENAAASDSCDSSVQLDSAGNSTYESNGENKTKEKRKDRYSFSKGFFDLVGGGSSSKSSATKASLQLSEDGEPEEPIPKLPKGKKLVDTVVATDVDGLYKSVFENDTFFEIIGSKSYEEFRNFECSRWKRNRSSELFERRMRYEISKNIAFSRQNVFVEQTQVKLGYSRKGMVYAVDTVTQNSGVVYSDYFRINIHYRFLADEEKPDSHSRLVVVAAIEFVKPCLFKGRIEAEAWSGLKKYYDIVDKEVQLERDVDSNTMGAAASSRITKKSKENYNRMLQRPGWDERESLLGLSSGDTFGRYMSQEIAFFAFLLIIVTLMLITMAMFKLNEAILSLDQRLSKIEAVLERNEKVFELLLLADNENQQ